MGCGERYVTTINGGTQAARAAAARMVDLPKLMRHSMERRTRRDADIAWIVKVDAVRRNTAAATASAVASDAAANRALERQPGDLQTFDAHSGLQCSSSDGDGEFASASAAVSADKAAATASEDEGSDDALSWVLHHLEDDGPQMLPPPTRNAFYNYGDEDGSGSASSNHSSAHDDDDDDDDDSGGKRAGLQTARIAFATANIRTATLQPAGVFAIIPGGRVQLWWSDMRRSGYSRRVINACAVAGKITPRASVNNPPALSQATPRGWKQVEIFRENPLMVSLLGSKRMCCAWYKDVMDILTARTGYGQRRIAVIIAEAVCECESRFFAEAPRPTHDEIFPTCYVRAPRNHGAEQQIAQGPHQRMFPIYIFPFIAAIFPQTHTHEAAAAAAANDDGDDRRDFALKVAADAAKRRFAAGASPTIGAVTVEQSAALAAASARIAAQEATEAAAAAAVTTVVLIEDDQPAPHAVGDASARPVITDSSLCARVEQLNVALSYQITSARGEERAWRGMVHAQLIANACAMRDIICRRLGAQLTAANEDATENRATVRSLRGSKGWYKRRIADVEAERDAALALLKAAKRAKRAKRARRQ